jgi:hypothetical protein
MKLYNKNRNLKLNHRKYNCRVTKMENKNTTKTEQMYCVKCRSKVIITGPDVTKWPNGKKAVHGNCPHCNTKTYKVVRHDWS